MQCHLDRLDGGGALSAEDDFAVDNQLLAIPMLATEDDVVGVETEVREVVRIVMPPASCHDLPQFETLFRAGGCHVFPWVANGFVFAPAKPTESVQHFTKGSEGGRGLMYGQGHG